MGRLIIIRGDLWLLKKVNKTEVKLKKKFKTSIIPYLPSEVSISDLCVQNGKLLSDKEIQDLKLSVKNDGRYSKSESNTKYTIIVQGGKYFAVYIGKKKLGEGSRARVKLVQNLDTGKWFALKIQSPNFHEPLISAKHELEQLTIAKQVIHAGSKPVAFERYSKSKKCNLHYMLINLGKGNDLFDFVMEKDVDNISCVTWFNIAQKVLEAAKQLHEKNILHQLAFVIIFRDCIQLRYI